MNHQLLCLDCHEITQVVDEQWPKVCPNCGSQSVPADWDDRRTVLITNHELRVLVMWAEFWASVKDDPEHKKMRGVVYGIADRLQQQHLDWAGLTFANELADLRALPEVKGPIEHNVIIEDALNREDGSKDRKDFLKP